MPTVIVSMYWTIRHKPVQSDFITDCVSSKKQTFRRNSMTTKRITRSASVDGNMVKLASPGFLSLVGKPANQRPFPVIRSADAAKGRIARTKRGESAVLMLMFPEGYGEDEVNACLIDYGMDGYTIVCEADIYYACRSDLQSVAKVTELKPSQVRLTSDGIVASVDPEQYQPKAAANSIGIIVTGYEFDKQTFDADKIIAWGTQNGVDISRSAIENSTSELICVQNTQVKEGTEVRRMELEAGVFAVITRDDAADGINTIPAGFVAVVNEAAYGNWGWGQLDFAASMADRAFCNLLDDAEYRLSSVIRQITFYSELPLDVRKQLVTRCLQQYGAFVNDAIDSLPRQVLLLASRADVTNKSITRKDDAMTKIDGVAAQKALDAIQATKRADAEKAAAAETQRQADEAAAVAATAATDAAAVEAKRAADEAAAAAAATAAAPAFVMPTTRAEFDTMVAAAIAAAAATPAAVVRSAEDIAADAAKVAATAAAAAPAALSREDLTKAMAEAVAAAVAPLTEKIERMEATTIVRSDNGDTKQAAAATAAALKTPEVVFRGAFGNIGGAVEK
jgi:hypothetical protein